MGEEGRKDFGRDRGKNERGIAMQTLHPETVHLHIRGAIYVYACTRIGMLVSVRVSNRSCMSREGDQHAGHACRINVTSP